MIRTRDFCKKYEIPHQTITKFAKALRFPTRPYYKGLRFYTKREARKLILKIREFKHLPCWERRRLKRKITKTHKFDEDILIETLIVYLNKLDFSFPEIQEKLKMLEININLKQIQWILNP